MSILAGRKHFRKNSGSSFIQREFAGLRPAFLQEAAQWIADGRLRYREDVVVGLDKAPAAFIDLLQGRNFG